MIKKNSTIANFNCTFGSKNMPMLEYFDKVVYPALKSDIIRKVKEDEYFFENVEITETNQGRAILRGILVKKTKLEVRTEYDEDSGITFTNKFYDSAPISIFNIFLDNHRMIYTTNQKGSPDIRSFNATVKEVMTKYIKEYNKELPKSERVPFPVLDVVSIPSSKNIKEKLKTVKKIRKLTFKLFNPNGDFSVGDTYDGLREQLKDLGSKKGAVSFNSPTKFKNVIETINDTKGLAEATLEVEYASGGKGKIDHDSMSERISLDLPEDSSIGTVAKIVTDTLKDRDELKFVSDENNKIYKKNLKKILRLK